MSDDGMTQCQRCGLPIDKGRRLCKGCIKDSLRDVIHDVGIVLRHEKHVEA